MKKLFSLSLIVLILFSCSKEESKEPIIQPDPIPEIIPDPIPDPNYMPMTIGNYWVYQNIKVETTGETDLNEYDSLVIVRDTMIRDHQYFVFEGNSFPSPGWRLMNILRDSSGYTVGPSGNIFFSYKSPGEIIYSHYFMDNIDTLAHVEVQMAEEPEEIILPIGQYSALNKAYTYNMFLNGDEYDSINIRKVNYYFIPEIGQATSGVFYASKPWHFEKRLIRYHIQETEE